MRFKVGEKVYYVFGYDLCEAKVLSIKWAWRDHNVNYLIEYETPNGNKKYAERSNLYLWRCEQ